MINTEHHPCQILKIKSPFLYLIEDMRHLHNQEKDKKLSPKVITIELLHDKQDPKGSKAIDLDKNESFYHLLPQIMIQKTATLTYSVVQQKMGKFLSQQQQPRKGYIYMNGQNILNLYKKITQVIPSNQVKEYSPQQIIECYVIKVECLKLVMLNLQNLKLMTFYFSEFKLVRPNSIHPKQSWEAAQKYFVDEIEGDFVQIKVNGTEVYREEMNVYGQILRTKNGDDIKEKIIADGYVELSKNAQKYLSKEVIEKFTQMAQHAKSSYKGIWGLKQNRQVKKSSNQAQQLKYKKWQQWLSDKTYPKIKSIEEEIKELLGEMKKLNTSNIDYNKGKTVLGVVQLLYQKVDDRKGLKNLHEAVKLLSQVFVQFQVTLMHSHSQMEFLKFYSKCLTFCIFYLEKVSDLSDPKSKQAFPSSSQMQKLLKTAFKTCYLGNETFNDRLFGKKKEANYESFSFDSAYLNGGISSYSQQSDYDQPQQAKYQNKENKKLTSAQAKIRVNSTYLMGLIFKCYPGIVETHWEICARSNILSQDFFQHLKKQKISADSANLSEAERKQLSLLLKNNFGDPSLLLLTIFEKNTKVRTNAFTCIYNMILNFQGKKMINTTESVYIEKLLKSTKSSYIPKSYIIFSGLKNILYFLLFTLKYEKNLQIIEVNFKTLCELCNRCSLLDKLQFEDGMKLLMENYIQPVLSFPWNIPELQQLKIVCISFLSVLVGTQKRWDQIQTNYLLSQGQANINLRLLNILKQHDAKQLPANSRLFEEIIKYFTKLPKLYFESIFVELQPNTSVWGYLSKACLQKVDPLMSNFVGEIFKFNFDQIKIEQENTKMLEENTKQPEPNEQSKRVPISQAQNLNKNTLLLPFLQQFIPLYASLTTNDNYLNLINILTNIQYSEWSSEGKLHQCILRKSKQFIFHIFEGLTGTKTNQKPSTQQFPSIMQIKENSLVRVCLIKLLGYMSFCPQFSSQQIITPSINLLLQYAKKYKSPNTVIKVTWAISNWAKVQHFLTAIKQQQLEQSITYLIEQSSSDKEKIASNSTRGIGFFLNHKSATGNLQDLRKKCRTSIIKNLDHVIIKVRTNSTKTLRSMVSELNNQERQKISQLLQQNILKNNYHLQSQTLMLIKQMGSAIEKKRLVSLFLSILKNLLNQSQLEYEFSEMKAIKQLRKIVLEEVVELIECVSQGDSVDVFITIYVYLLDCYNEDKSRNQGENQILEKGQQRGQQVQKLIFNIKNKITYNEQNIITTQTTLKGFEFMGKKSDLTLIEKIKKCAQNKKNYTLCSEWSQLQAINIESDHVAIGNLYI